MPKNQEFTEAQRKKAIKDYFSKAKTQKQIAKELNCATITVAKWVAWAREGRPMASMTSTRGRKSSIAKAHARWVQKTLEKKPKISMAQLTRELNAKYKTSYSSGVILRYARSLKKNEGVAQDPSISELINQPRGSGLRGGPKSVKGRAAYPSDLSDEQWQLIARVLVDADESTRRKNSVREIVNGIRYVALTGIQWSYLPNDLPSARQCRKSYASWLDDGTWQEINFNLSETLEIAEDESEVEYEFV